MTEIFEALAVIDAPVSDEDKVVHLLASLPNSFNILVTALEANSEAVLKMENVTERLLYEEQKMKEKGDDGRKALTAKGNPKRHLTCHHVFARSLANLNKTAGNLLLNYKQMRSLASQSIQQTKLLQRSKSQAQQVMMKLWWLAMLSQPLPEGIE